MTHQLTLFTAPNNTYWIRYSPNERGEMVIVARYDSEAEAEAERGWMDVIAARRDEDDDRDES